MYIKQLLATILIQLAIINILVGNCCATFAWEFHCGTWNMQCAQDGWLSSWSRLWTVLGRAIEADEEPIPVMALQEAGEAPPYTARFLSEPNVHYMYRTDIVATDNVREYLWETGTRSRRGLTYYIYHVSINTQVELDRGSYEAQWTNLAIVSLQRADSVRLFRLDTQFRPVLCIQIGNAFFCSLHANNRFNQAPRTVFSMEDAFQSIRQTTGIPMQDNRLISDHYAVPFSQLHLNPNHVPRPDPEAPSTSSNWLLGLGATVPVNVGQVIAGT